MNYIFWFPSLIRISDIVWSKQKFWITNGVPLSIKFDPNLIFSVPQDFNCLRTTDRLAYCKVVRSSFFKDFVDELNTHDARVKMSIFVVMASTRIMGNMRKTGIGISLCIVMHTHCTTICSNGTPQTMQGTIFSIRYAFIIFSISWIIWYWAKHPSVSVGEAASDIFLIVNKQ